jgi:hypothetical protein
LGYVDDAVKHHHFDYLLQFSVLEQEIHIFLRKCPLNDGIAERDAE